MIEIVSIILFLIFYSVLFCKNIFIKNAVFSFKDINYNIVILLNLCLFCSFFLIGKFIIIFICIFLFLKNLNFFYNNFKNIKFIVFFIINAIFFILLALNPDLGWDGLVNWYPKAYSFFNDQQITSLNDLPRSDYPHLGSYIWSLGWYFNPLKSEYFGRLIYVFIYLSSIFLFLDLVKKNLNMKIFIIFFLIILTINFDLFKGYQEHLIFSLLCFFMFIYNTEKKLDIFLFYSLLIINSLVWIKNEAIIFVVPMFFLIMINKNINNKRRFLFSISFFIILFLRFFLIKFFGEANFQGNWFTYEKILIEVFNFQTFFSDSYYILKYLIFGIIKNPIILLFLIVNIYSYYKNKFYNFNILHLFYLTVLLELIFIYHIVDNKNLVWLLSTTMDRLLFQVSGLLIFDTVIKLKKFK